MKTSARSRTCSSATDPDNSSLPLLREFLTDLFLLEGLTPPQQVSIHEGNSASARLRHNDDPQVMTEYISLPRQVLRITRTDLSGSLPRQVSSCIPSAQSPIGRFLALTGLHSLVIYS